jgi:hypothetical protein
MPSRSVKDSSVARTILNARRASARYGAPNTATDPWIRAKERRPYWRQRKAAPRPDGSVLAELSLQDEWLRVVN